MHRDYVVSGRITAL